MAEPGEENVSSVNNSSISSPSTLVVTSNQQPGATINSISNAQPVLVNQVTATPMMLKEEMLSSGNNSSISSPSVVVTSSQQPGITLNSTSDGRPVLVNQNNPTPMILRDESLSSGNNSSMSSPSGVVVTSSQQPGTTLNSSSDGRPVLESRNNPTQMILRMQPNIVSAPAQVPRATAPPGQQLVVLQPNQVRIASQAQLRNGAPVMNQPLPMRPPVMNQQLPMRTNFVLMKTENGLQLINVGGARGLPQGMPPQFRFINPVSIAQNIPSPRPQQQPLQSVMVMNNHMPVRPAAPTMNQTLSIQTPQQNSSPQNIPSPRPQQSPLQPVMVMNNHMAVRPAVAPMSQPLTIQTPPQNSSQATTPSQMSPNTAKKKCKNFLSTLIRLASDQPEQVATNVRNLIQGLIDGTIVPEDFTNQLQRELNSSPQPCLIPFLKKSLPYLRHSLMVREMSIDGVRPPPAGSVTLPQQQSAIPQIHLAQQRQPMPNQYRFMVNYPPTTIVQPMRPTVPGGMMGSTPTIPAAIPASLQSQMPPAQPTPTKTPSKSKSKAKTPASKGDKKSNFTTINDDDINDVAAMGGVNLQEEHQRMAAPANEVGTQIRSCKDENFLFTMNLSNKINEISRRMGIPEEPSPDVISMVSHAAQEYLKTMVEKLGIIAEHRLENFKMNPKYEPTQDVRAQIKFLEELDKLEKKRHEEQEREMLMRAAKSRSKLEDPEQLKLKQKAKEMQRAELEEARQREANETALLAIGPRKKPRLDGPSSVFPDMSSTNNSFPTPFSGLASKGPDLQPSSLSELLKWPSVL